MLLKILGIMGGLILLYLLLSSPHTTQVVDSLGQQTTSLTKALQGR